MTPVSTLMFLALLLQNKWQKINLLNLKVTAKEKNWIKLVQFASNWIRLDRIETHWKRLDEIGDHPILRQQKA